jgi:hypothetical protein
MHAEAWLDRQAARALLLRALLSHRHQVGRERSDRGTRTIGVALAVAAVLVTSAGCGSEPAPSIHILGTEVVGSAVIVKVKIVGWRMAPPRQGWPPKPRTGQWQIFVDNRYAGFSYNRTWGTINGVSAGSYHVWVALARTDYSLVWPLIRSPTVVVRVGNPGY